jgi:hypothetical protein
MSGDADGLLSIQVRSGHPDFLDLPWPLPLADWAGNCPRLVEVQRGLSRHEVRFVSYGDAIYALKELPAGTAEREYGVLRAIEQHDLPAVRPVGLVTARAGGEENGVLLTRFLEGSLPYRTLFMQPGLARYRTRLLHAMAGMLVRLHLAGVYWGDCSLSNTLFRRDAGALQAWLVDAETSEVQEDLSAGRRGQDLDIMEENVEGELADLAAVAELPGPLARDGTGAVIRNRYRKLWDEITREDVIPASESYRIHERIRALNELGFTVGEVSLMATGEGDRLRMRPVVTDRDYHRHELHNLTGIVAANRQAQQMLNEIRELRATMARELDRSVPMSAAALHWLEERFRPVVRRRDPRPTPGISESEFYCQVLEHKWFLSEQARRDVGLETALDDYLKRFPGRVAD